MVYDVLLAPPEQQSVQGHTHSELVGNIQSKPKAPNSRLLKIVNASPINILCQALIPSRHMNHPAVAHSPTEYGRRFDKTMVDLERKALQQAHTACCLTNVFKLSTDEYAQGISGDCPERVLSEG
eukprot:scaffold119329_cov32-Prasinocladus_malaysianus.AAC.2